jgi:hypothetical protein
MKRLIDSNKLLEFPVSQAMTADLFSGGINGKVKVQDPELLGPLGPPALVKTTKIEMRTTNFNIF